MIRSFFGFIRALMYKFIGDTDEATEYVMRRNPNAIKAKYDDIISRKTNSVNEFLSALAEMKSSVKKRKAELQTVVARLKEYATVKKGAEAVTKRRVAELKSQGLTSATRRLVTASAP